LKANPNMNGLHMIIGNALMGKGDYGAAVKEFEELSKRLPQDQQVSYNLTMALGQRYFSQKNFAKAEEAFRKALSLDKNSMAAYTLLAQLFIAQNARDKAIRECKNALKVNPKSVQTHVMLGFIYESQNDREAAKFQYGEALLIDPTSPVAANNMAWILAESGSELDEALKLAQTAAKKLPDLTSAQDTLGWIYFKKGAYKSAIEILSDCARKEPKNPTFRYHLGMSYYKNGDSQKAKESLEEAIRPGSSFPGIEEAKQTLAKL